MKLRRGNLTRLRSFAWILVLAFLLYVLHLRHQSLSDSATPVAANDLTTSPSRDIGLISFVSGVPSKKLVTATETYERYAQRHGYPVFLERSEVNPGAWYLTLSLLSVLLEQLGKAPAR